MYFNKDKKIVTAGLRWRRKRNRRAAASLILLGLILLTGAAYLAAAGMNSGSTYILQELQNEKQKLVSDYARLGIDLLSADSLEYIAKKSGKALALEKIEKVSYIDTAQPRMVVRD